MDWSSLKENTNGIFSSINPFILFPVPTVTSYAPLSGCTSNMKSFKHFMLFVAFFRRFSFYGSYLG